MAQNEFVPRAQLVEELGNLSGQQASGFFTVLTKTNRSVLIYLHDGKITGFQARSRDADESIQLLLASATVKYFFSESQTDDNAEIMPLATFVSTLNAGGVVSTAATNGSSNIGEIKSAILGVAVDYIGIMAETIVDEALAAENNPTSIVDYIAGTIPDKSQAAAFKTAAKGAL